MDDIGDQPPEIVIRWVKELRRTVDYLEQRPDIDSRRMAYYGMYIGATHAPIVLAVEPRIKAGFIESGALDKDLPAPPPEVDPFNFLPRVRTPFMIMNSHYSSTYPYATSQMPMLEYLGTPEEHKRLLSGEYRDPVPFTDIFPVVPPWLDEYLGSVEGF